MNIYLIRHGRQCSTLCSVDVPLSEEGRRQSILVGKRLEHGNIDAVYSSSLIRAVETSREANRFWDAPHIIRPELKEISFGEMEGLTDLEIAVKFADFKKEQEKLETDIPYPGGECAGDVIRRAMPVFKEIAESGYEHVAVVTHGGLIRAMVTAFLYMEPKNYRILGNSLENSSITEVRWKKESECFFVERFNDYAHLEPYPELLRARWIDTEN